MCTLTRGERFKDARNIHNKNGKQTMDEVYAATHITGSMITDLEDDEKKRSVGYDKIVALSNHYGVSADYLLGLTDDPNIHPRATDELGLSVQAIDWLSSLANSPDKNRYSKCLNALFEMNDFQHLIHLLVEYFSAIEASTIAANILQDYTSGAPILYPSFKSYFSKLDAAANDPKYDDMVQLYLKAIASFEKGFRDDAFTTVLDDENSVIHVIDILELKIKRNFDSILRRIENLYTEHAPNNQTIL
jgi:transcriptional regulator with XRE-family HTH domain